MQRYIVWSGIPVTDLQKKLNHPPETVPIDYEGHYTQHYKVYSILPDEVEWLDYARQRQTSPAYCIVWELQEQEI